MRDLINLCRAPCCILVVIILILVMAAVMRSSQISSIERSRESDIES